MVVQALFTVLALLGFTTAQQSGPSWSLSSIAATGGAMGMASPTYDYVISFATPEPNGNEPEFPEPGFVATCTGNVYTTTEVADMKPTPCQPFSDADVTGTVLVLQTGRPESPGVAYVGITHIFATVNTGFPTPVTFIAEATMTVGDSTTELSPTVLVHNTGAA